MEEDFPLRGEAVSPSLGEVASPFSVASASPVPPEEINPALPDETVMASAEAVAMQDNTDSPRDPTPNPLCFCTCI